MASCASCGTTILFGGKESGGMKFCSDKCLANRSLLDVMSRIPETVVREQAAKIQAGACPNCKGEGPVELHMTHAIWSALIVTNWSSTAHICCRGCATKKQALSATGAFLLGWWGFPWGFIMTPVQVTKNIGGLFAKRSKSEGPSPELVQQVRLIIASHASRQATR